MKPGSDKRVFGGHRQCREIVDTAVKLVDENNDGGAILFECSDMPPYAAHVQQAVQLPVFDFIALIRWLHNAKALHRLDVSSRTRKTADNIEKSP